MRHNRRAGLTGHLELEVSEPEVGSHVAKELAHPGLTLCVEKALGLSRGRSVALFVWPSRGADPICLANAGNPSILERGRDALGASRKILPPDAKDWNSPFPLLHADGIALVALQMPPIGKMQVALLVEVSANRLNLETTRGRLNLLRDLCEAALALAVERMELARHVERFSALEHTLGDFTAPMSVRRAVDLLLRGAIQFVRSDLALVALSHTDLSDLVVEASMGAGQAHLVGARLPLADGPSGMVLLAGRPLNVRDSRTDPRAGGGFSGIEELARMRSLLGVPIPATRGVIGSLWMARCRVNPFEEADADVLEILARHAGAAVEQAQTVEAERTDHDALIQTAEALEKRCAFLGRLISLQEQVTDTVLGGGQLEGIAMTLAGALGCAVFIAGPSFQTLARAPAPGTGATDNRVVAEILRAMLEGRSQDEVRSGGRVFPAPPELRASQDASCAVVPILAGGELLGYLCSLCETRRLQEADLQLVAQGARAAALELLRQRARHDAGIDAKANLLADLLREDQIPGSDVNYRALHLGYRIDHAHVLCLVDTGATPERRAGRNGHEVDWRRAQQAKDELCGLVRDTLDLLRMRALLLSRNEGVVVVTPIPEKEQDPRRFAHGLAESIQRAIAAREDNVRVCVGISRPCSNPVSYRVAFQQAGYALRVAKVSDGDGRIRHYDELGVYRVLLEGADPAVLRNTISDMLGPLMALPSTRKEELLTTLDVFLQHNGTLATAASALSLHPHSLRYRLRTIERLLGIDLDDAESRLNLHLAVRMHRFFESASL